MKKHSTFTKGAMNALVILIAFTELSFSQSEPGNVRNPSRALRVQNFDFNGLSVAQDGQYTTNTYTFADIVIFSYFDDTSFDLFDDSGRVLWSGTLSAESFRSLTPGDGTYGLRSTKPFSVLIGDPVSLTVLGYFAVDERGKGVGTKLLTYMPRDEWGPERFVVFAYEDNTEVRLTNLSTNTIVWSGLLDRGEHFISSGLERTFLMVESNKGVSALSYTDQGYAVPDEDGNWTGKKFYGYAGYVGNWPEDLNLIGQENGAQITVRNSITGALIWNGTLNQGELRSMTITSQASPETFFEVESNRAIAVSVSPYTAFTAQYFHLTGGVAKNGSMIGKLFYVPAIADARLDFSSFEDNNVVRIKRMGNNQVVWNGTLMFGENVTVTVARGVYEITGTGDLAGVESWGGTAGGEFRPVFYGADLPDLAVRSADISVDPEFAEVGVTITLRAVVRNQGNSIAVSVSTRFYDGDPQQGGIPIGNAIHTPQIFPGDETIVTVQWTVPQDPGHHRIFVVVDEENGIDESNESNNVAERSFFPNNELEPPLALVIDAPQGLDVDPSGNYVPDPFQIHASITNNGSLTCSSIAASLVLPPGLTLVNGQPIQHISTLPQGDTRTVTWSVRATGDRIGDLPYSVEVSSANCGSKTGQRLIRVPAAPFTANITARWHGQRTGNVEVSVDRGNGFESVGTINSSGGPLQVVGLKVTDKLRGMKRVHTQPAVKSGHEAVDNIMFELWADSDMLQRNGDYLPFEIANRTAQYELDLSHVIYEYNLVVSIRWEERENNTYYNQLVTGFKRASRYLYDATDGQAMFNRVAIYDGKEKWSDADMRIYPEYHPKANVDGIDKSSILLIPFGRMFFGRTWSGQNPDHSDYFRTIVHEFGHYAFGLYDEYLNGHGNQEQWDKYRLAHLLEVPTNYGVMDRQYDITEFSSANDYLMSYPEINKEKVTKHYYIRRVPTWDWLKQKLQGYFSEAIVKLPPPGYFPDGPRIDREGPDERRIEDLTEVIDMRGATLLASASGQKVFDSEIEIVYGGAPLPGAHVYAVRSNDRRYLGRTDSAGAIYWPGFQLGSKLEISRLLRRGLLRSEIHVVELSPRYMISLEEVKTGVYEANSSIQDRGFVFLPEFSLNGNQLTMRFRLYSDGSLSSNPELTVNYGNTSSALELMPAGVNEFAGALTFSTQTPDFDGSAVFAVEAMSTTGETINFTSTFDMFFMEHDGFTEAFGEQIDVHFSDDNVSQDQMGSISATYALPHNASNATLYPVSAMYYLYLERDQAFNGRAGVNIHYSDGEVAGVDENSLAIFEWQSATKNWVELPSSGVDVDGNVVSGLINRTGVYCVFAKTASGDNTAPDRVDDLGATTGAGQGEIRLTWRAPGDDEDVGRATSYVIRFNQIPISHLNWDDSFTIANPPRPGTHGTEESVIVAVPNSNKLFYFALKTRDEAGNESALSNNAAAISGTGDSPAVFQVQPASGEPGETLTLTISGANFRTGATLSFSGTGISANSISFVNSGRINAIITIAADAAPGPRDVIVRNPDGQQAFGPGLFTVEEACSNQTFNFSDNFQNGNANDWHPVTSSSWLVQQVDGDLAYCLVQGNSTGNEYTFLPTSLHDFVLELDAKSTASSNKGYLVIFGADGFTNEPLNHYVLRFLSTGVTLFRVVNGSATELRSVSGDFVGDNRFHRIRIERNFPRIKVSVDGSSLFEVSDASIAQGYIGFGVRKRTGCFDNVAITGTTCQPSTVTATIHPDVTSPQPIGGEFWVDINVSSVDNLFGVSFELDFSHTSFIDVVTPTSSSVVPGPFLGSDLVFVSDVDEGSGKVSVGVSRKAGQGGVSGDGVVARIRLLSRPATPPSTEVRLSLTNIVATDPAGNSITMNPSDARVSFAGLLVWPGDTNDDGLVDQSDVLPVGLCWAQTGPARSNISCAWQGQPVAPWSNQNCAHADANGDGIVDQADVLCIGLNWGRTHSLMASVSQAIESAALSHGVQQTASMELLIDGDPDPGQEFAIDILAKDMTDLFGVSFELMYQPQAFLELLSVEPGNNNLLGDDIIFFPNIDAAAGKVSIGVSRKAGQGTVGGSGRIARILARMSPTAITDQDTTWLSFVNLAANDADGNSFPVTSSMVPLVTEVEDVVGNSAPESFGLYSNYPNPFNPETTIRYQVAKSTHVTINIFNLKGQKIVDLVDEDLARGIHEVVWHGVDRNRNPVASGIYLVRMVAGDFVASRKLLLVR